MDKIATRAWKKNYGNLSEATKQRLVDTGIHNYKKELDGINKGTNQILKKNNARALFGKNQIMETLKRDHPNLPDQAIKTLSNSISNTVTIPIKYRNPNAPSAYNLFQSRRMESGNKEIEGYLNKFVPNYNMQKNDALGKLYSDAIMRRHEADEVRAVNAIGRRKKNVLKTIDPFSATDTAFSLSSHSDPSVILRESANVALAPKSTQNHYKGLRLDITDNEKRSRGKDLYANIMGQYGQGYGKGAVFNKRQYKAFKAGNRNMVNYALNNLPTRFDFLKSKRPLQSVYAKRAALADPRAQKIFFSRSNRRKAFSSMKDTLLQQKNRGDNKWIK